MGICSGRGLTSQKRQVSNSILLLLFLLIRVNILTME